MKYSASEKMEIIRLVEDSALSVTRVLTEIDVSRSSFYRWYRAYAREGYEGLMPKPVQQRRLWNRIPQEERARVVKLAIEKPGSVLLPHQLAP